MYGQIKQLRYWKTEGNAEKCEDACECAPERGLFAIADGVGSSSFANIWARIIATHFVTQPLLSPHPFEVEWWLRPAQDSFKQQAPRLEDLPSFAIEKAREGSHSTLATLRLTGFSDDDHTATAEILVFGDSCVIVANAETRQVSSFAIDSCAGFETNPVCLPTNPTVFYRYFHMAHSKQITLKRGDTVILATDAVAKWILCAGLGRQASVWDAFQDVARQTAATWATFIQNCRHRDKLIDDDSTVIILTLTDPDVPAAQPLGSTTLGNQDGSVLQQRITELDSARQQGNRILMATVYGDGQALTHAGYSLDPAEVDEIRKVSDAWLAMRTAFTKAVRQDANILREVGPLWAQHGPLLEAEPAAQTLRKSLAKHGVTLHNARTRPAETPSPSPSNPTGTGKELFRDALQTRQAGQVEAAYPPNRTTGLSEAERQPIAAARSHTIMLHDLAQALEAHDDERVARVYDRTLAAQFVDMPEVKAKAQEISDRVQALHAFRSALERDSAETNTSEHAERIVRSYNPALLDGYHLVTPNEHAQYTQAVRHLEILEAYRIATGKGDPLEIVQISGEMLRNRIMPESRMVYEQIIDAFHEIMQVWKLKHALALNDTDKLREALETCAPGIYQHPTLTEQEQAGIRQFLLQLKLETFHRNLARNDDEQIIGAWDEKLNDYPPATGDRMLVEYARQRMEAYHSFLAALETENDQAIATSYTSMLDEHPAITQQQRDRLDHARRRMEGLTRLRETLATRNIRDLARTYTTALDQNFQLDTEEWQMIESAHRFCTALDHGDARQIMATSKEMQSVELLPPQLSANDLDRLNLAIDRKHLLDGLVQAMANNDHELIRKIADRPELNDYSFYTEEERRRIAEARHNPLMRRLGNIVPWTRKDDSGADAR